jgi:hypothetical protein
VKATILSCTALSASSRVFCTDQQSSKACRGSGYLDLLLLLGPQFAVRLQSLGQVHLRVGATCALTLGCPLFQLGWLVDVTSLVFHCSARVVGGLLAKLLLESNGVRGLKTRRALNAQARDLAQHQSALSLSHEQGVQLLIYILINGFMYRDFIVKGRLLHVST